MRLSKRPPPQNLWKNDIAPRTRKPHGSAYQQAFGRRWKHLKLVSRFGQGRYYNLGGCSARGFHERTFVKAFFDPSF